MVKKDTDSARDVNYTSWEYQPGQKNVAFQWGPHKLPLALDFEGISITMYKHDNGFLYRREGRGESVEKVVLADKGSFQLSPVEPFHLPVGMSTYLLIAFKQPVDIEPRAKKTVLVTFPLELASAFNSQRAGLHILDIFTLGRPKFTLYGTIKDGLICKYWSSEVFYSVPEINQVEEGVMELELQNISSRWIEISKAVFSAQGLKIYYDQNLVSLKATMKISGESVAETSFIDEPLKAGMSKALEQYREKLLTQPGRTLMEEGF